MTDLYLVPDEIIRMPRKQAPRAFKINAEAVVRAVCKSFQIERGVLLSADRHEYAVIPRAAAAHLMREWFKMSFPKIGAHLNRDHASIFNLIKNRVPDLMTDPAFTRHIDRIGAVMRLD